MGFGVNNRTNFFYTNSITIISIVLILFLTSVDTVNRYFTLLNLEDLENSAHYGILRLLLFFILTCTIIFDKKLCSLPILNVLYFFSFLCLISIFIGSTTIDGLFKAFVYTLSFVFMFRYGLLFGRFNSNFKALNIAIVVAVIVLLVKYFTVYLFSFNSIYIISNDAIFSLVVFVPLLYFLKSKKIMIILLVLISLCTFFSQKRSAIIFVNFAFLLSTIIYLGKFSKIKSFVITFLISLFVIGFFVSIKDVDFVSLAIARFENDGYNGRNQITDLALEQFYRGNIINNLFGFGYAASILNNGVPNHNDYLEIVYDFGIIALLVYATFIILLGMKCFTWFKYRKQFIDYYLSYVVGYIILLGLSLFNSMIFSIYNVVLFLGLGVSYGYINLKLKK